MNLNLPPKNSPIVKTFIFAAETFLVWLMIMAQVFVFNRFSGNEVDVLPTALQVADHSWLPNDWYLNLDIGYRQLFGYLVGYLIDQLGFLYGAYAGRLMAYLLLALGLVIFFRAIRLRFSLGLIVTIFFLGDQSLIAGEWIVGGVDTKTFAYAFALLAFAFFVQKKYLAGFTFAGAALSFHMLVGIYALFCTGFAMVLSVKPWRIEWRSLVRQAWPFFITGIFGLLAILQQLFLQREIDANKAWDIYVNIRVPHHVLPSSWGGDPWLLNIALATGLFLAIYLLKNTKEAKFTAAYALGSVCLFTIGLVIYAVGGTNLLRFYWFRYGDVMIPFLGMVMVALIVSDLTYVDLNNSLRIFRRWPSVQDLLSKGLPIFLAMAVILLTWQSIKVIRTMYLRGVNNRPPKILTSLEWISLNTPEQAVFLVDPMISEFYIYAQRAEFVSFNHSPQSAGDILEWYKRIELSNGGQSLRVPVPKGELSTNFYHLEEGSIRHIAQEYGLSYYMGLAEQQLPLEIVYRDDNISLYKIKQSNESTRPGTLARSSSP
jgi:hypothetical protein